MQLGLRRRRRLGGRGVREVWRWSEEMAVSSTQIFFQLKMVKFGALWVLFFMVRLPVLHQL